MGRQYQVVCCLRNLAYAAAAAAVIFVIRGNGISLESPMPVHFQELDF